MMTHKLTIPIPEETIRTLHIGDTVRLSGVITTARDIAHKHLVETFIKSDSIPASEHPLYEELKRLLDIPSIPGTPPHPSPLANTGPKRHFVG
jgi:hypothetical protein